MDALLLRSLQDYVIDTFSQDHWLRVCQSAGIAAETFEPMLRYEPGLADRIAGVAAGVLGRPVEAIWEDVGIYLVTNPDREGVRRLLRFGGMSYSEFLYSLVEMPGRARLAMPDLDLPEVTLEELAADRFRICCQSHLRGTQRVLAGVLTAMADDYGALCVIEPEAGGCTTISILDSRHASGRQFALATPER